jgi:hypothetical protein
MRTRETQPNLFKGDIDERQVASRMAQIVERSTFTPKGNGNDLIVERVPMSKFDTQYYKTERAEVEGLIRNVMSGTRLSRHFDTATQLLTVRNSSSRATLLGAALCSIGTYQDFDSMTNGDVSLPYAWYISAYGTRLDNAGRMDEHVLRRIARQSRDCLLDVLDTVYSLYGTYHSEPFTTALYIDAAHSATPTIISDGIHHRIAQLMGALDRVTRHPAQMGTGFPAEIAKIDECVGLLKSEHATDPFIQSLSTSLPIARTLSYQSVSMGGDESTYKNMQRVAAATQKFFESLQFGLDASYLRLTDKTLAKNPVLEASEDTTGNISVLADQQRGYPEAAVYLSPEGELQPAIRFGEGYRQQEYVPALLGELWKKVTTGKWWQSEVAAK